MQIVAADIGNSTSKIMVGEYRSDEKAIVPVWEFSRSIDNIRSTRVWEQVPVAHWLVSSVNDGNAKTLQVVASERSLVGSWNHVDRSMIPLGIELPQPDSVGVDRLLAAHAATSRYADGKSCIVIDCGTALTVDFVSSESVFQGGSIVAGPSACLRALADLTDALPDLSNRKIEPPDTPMGRNTEEAMLAGAYFSQLGTIREIVSRYQKLAGDQSVVVGTGGAIGKMSDDLPEDWILVDNLVLEALFQIGPALLEKLESQNDAR